MDDSAHDTPDDIRAARECEPGEDADGEVYELPGAEALVACTLALMTGYSQSLQADLHPSRRVVLGDKIGRQLALIAGRRDLSDPFRRIVAGLQRHWVAMAACTAASAPDAAGAAGGAARDPATQRAVEPLSERTRERAWDVAFPRPAQLH